MTDKNSSMRQLPKVDEMIRCIASEGITNVPAVLVKLACQKEIELERQKILSGSPYQYSREDLIRRIKAEIEKQNQPHLRKVINGTGVVLHTNLGRARLSQMVSENMKEICGSYSNLEYDLETGERGTRYEHVEQLLTFLTGSEAALVVNNNAAAVYLVLNSVANGKEVIVSRGELVEIGGAFRVPEIMTASGCRLVEVGTTNKTHESDYEENINENTGALLKVHTSNYKIIGFTDEVSLERMKEVGKKHGLPLIYDLGSGLLVDLKAYGIGDEPTVRSCLEQNADIVCFSGDKLLGGPQAGIIVGKAEYINRMKKNHLLRALRIDKLTLTALEFTLRQYLTPEMAVQQIPTLKMITEPLENLKKKAELLHGLLVKRPDVQYEVTETTGQIGGGSMPGVNLSSYAVSISMEHISADMLERMLRNNSVPIISRIYKNKVLLDVRTMSEEDLFEAAEFLNKIINLKGDME
ncbi:L-seryl-tRNA(Sec) selenium transferase [Lacrimispora defluvii]|uniref:L-seryl-tRNA(Sec) selenium transferase n=1 Tax=Lacrimispora defluvii TaxID=2719233 RepID=A0ABX1VXV2_9FIRM|nr:L-seryl-tRNA(Sec) selenium transferase [Lacrimispora defluvii]NNJ33273.1 L-seryl-tRNA(Sec) selenium transferase [Lacrimispora defluvii]